jgi:hypothetical protein
MHGGWVASSGIWYYYAGLDVSLKETHVCVLAGGGQRRS